jgi:hypothetical protein
MPIHRSACMPLFLLVSLLWNVQGSAQDAPGLMLTTDSEAAFQRLIRMAQTGQLGDDVTNANVGIVKNRAVVELVRTGAPTKLLYLTPKSSTDGTSRYFDVTPGEGARASDVARVGKALDDVFGEAPFQLAPEFFDAVPGGVPIRPLADAWRFGGWRGVMHALERHTVALAGRAYAIGVTVGLAAGMLASLLLLWGSNPPRSAPGRAHGGAERCMVSVPTAVRRRKRE